MANTNTAKDGESAVLAAIGATRSCGAMGRAQGSSKSET
jgi:hypothetical protein